MNDEIFNREFDERLVDAYKCLHECNLVSINTLLTTLSDQSIIWNSEYFIGIFAKDLGYLPSTCRYITSILYL